MSIEEKATFLRAKLDAMPLSKRIPLGNPGLRMLNTYYDLTNGLDRDISEWEAKD